MSLLVPTVSDGIIGGSSPTRTSAVLEDEPLGDGFERRPPKDVIVTPSEDRTVKRSLGGIQLFMITVNCTLGTGLYWRGGQILELGGPLAVTLSFLLVGFLSWAIMQCITEMLCIWPIPGALSVYVSEFVDAELGIAVGVAYWFTYSVAFPGLNATVAAELLYWVNNRVFDSLVVYTAIPLLLIGINSFDVKTYGRIEVVFGTLKLLFLFIICALVIASTKKHEGSEELRGIRYWTAPLQHYDTDAGQNWVVCFFQAMSIASFAYVGVEIVAASALEVQWPKTKGDGRVGTDMSRRSREALLVGKVVKFSATWIPILATVAYTFAGTLATLDISRVDPRLPRLSWLNWDSEAHHRGETTSVFVAIGQNAKSIPHLDDVFNTFLVFTAITCSNTNLYVASRALFGLTSRLDGGSTQPSRTLRILAWFGRTNDRKVPARAMWFSAFAFAWVPFLELKGGQGIGMFVEVLSAMGSVSTLIVWTCNCWAFIRYYNCISRHRQYFEAQQVSQVRRWDFQDRHDYPYRSHGQPILGWIALAGCVFLLVVANSASLWIGFYLVPFLSSYLIVISFIALFVLLKVIRGAEWSLVDLSNAEKAADRIRMLHDIRLGAS